METTTIPAAVHGRFLFEKRPGSRLLVGFHGYAQTAETSIDDLQQIPGAGEWSLLAIQALHPFYTRNYGAVVASWMTRQDRELAIEENVAYVRSVFESLEPVEKVVVVGFSQGGAMAWRAAARCVANPAGIISLGADVPPDVSADRGVKLPPVFLARGARDELYTEEKLKKDLSFLEPITTVRSLVFDGGHEWSDEFRKAAGEFLKEVG